eukprot:Blabericola_migrator_1__10873@NODE_626_length_7188_cov_20_892290_g457_i0_p3_GENE_NODE_626_length_7188_cov_20_892290_g457_i0NODE_626_length_7188_cov_20_892290_g457_i0_p3_ORF_typecomplete_len118_score24_26_NODE_626_length_7188_cov_20_892290_g457_i0543896
MELNRTRHASKGAITFRAKSNVDELFALYLLFEFIKACGKITGHKNKGKIVMRKIEFLQNMGFQINHRIWIQVMLGWPEAAPEETNLKGPPDPSKLTIENYKRSLYLNLCDHFSWVA